VAVETDRDIYRFFDPADEIAGCFRHDKAGHILDAEGIAVKGGKFLCHPDKHRGAVDRARGIGDRTLEMGTGFLDPVHRALHVPDIVERIENTEDIHPVFIGRVDKPVDNIVRIVAVSHQVLATEEHLDRGVFQLCF